MDLWQLRSRSTVSPGRNSVISSSVNQIYQIRDGKLTLWRDGQTQPEQIYDIRADTLPPADRLLLQRGIRAQSREELWQILENYLD